MSKELEEIKTLRGFNQVELNNDKNVNKSLDIIEKGLLKLDFLEDAMDLPTNCFSTFKNRNGDEVTVMRREIYEEQEKENQKYKQLKEQIGCPLEVVFKALKNGIYYKDAANHMRFMTVDLHINLDGEYVLYFSDEEYVLTKNYKKTWWLCEDKSDADSECENCLYCKYADECDESYVKEPEKIKIKFGDLTPRELVKGFESVYIFRDKETNEMMVEYALRCDNDFVYLDKDKLDNEIGVDKNIIKPELHNSTSIKDMTLRQIVNSKPLDEFGDVSLDEEYWFGGQSIRVRYYGD